MATDATGTPTLNYSIPKFNTAADSPSGKGVNAMMDSIDTLIPFTKNLVTTKGDLIVVTAAGTYARLATASDGQVLTTDSASSGGVKWALAAGVPTGSVIQYGAASAPSGWVLCDGSSLLRSGGGYDALFAVIGTTYGFVDGTHFNVPDFRGRVPAGYAASGGHTDVATLGNNDGVATASRRPKHDHTVNEGSGHSHPPLSTPGGRFATDTSSGSESWSFGSGTKLTHLDSSTGLATTGLTVGSAGVRDTPAYLVINYIIKT